MAEAAGYAEFITCDAATCNGMCEAPEVHFAPAIQRALAAAEQAGWVLRPVEPAEEMVDDLAIKLYEERARNRGLPMAKWENAPELVRSLERRDAATAYRLVLAAAPKVTPWPPPNARSSWRPSG